MPSPWDEFLEVRPESAYFAKTNTLNRRRRDFFSTRFSKYMDQYLGALGQQVGGGDAPTQTWRDFLGGMNFNNEFGTYSPEQRGERNGLFSPLTLFRGFEV